MARTWYGREVQEHYERISNLREHIPHFERWPFSIEDSENEYLDLIAREPHGDGKHIPVAAVSKDYNLVEHHEMLETVLTALENHVEDPQSLEAELRLSKYGARMWIAFLLPNWKFDPGDGYPVVLQVNCLNSVDKSIAVRIHLSWHREKSDTEMQGRMLKRNHDAAFKIEEIEEFLAYQFHRFSKEEGLYKKWYETKLDWKSVVNWINKTVAEKWGAHTAVRAYHIAKTGNDIEIEKVFCFTHADGASKRVKLSSGSLQLEKSDFIVDRMVQEDNLYSIERPITGRMVNYNEDRFLKVKTIHKVPGLFTPVENVYHASQVLSWIASQQGTIENQLKRLGQIHGLMDTLLKQKKVTLSLVREYKKIK